MASDRTGGAGRVVVAVLTAAIVLAVLGVVILVVVLLRGLPADDLDERLAATPGYDLQFPQAEALSDNHVSSLGSAGAMRSRWWGVTGSVEDFAAATDAALTELGWTKVPGSEDDRVIGHYRLDDALYEIDWGELPARVPGGQMVGRGSYDFVAITLIANGERAGG